MTLQLVLEFNCTTKELKAVNNLFSGMKRVMIAKREDSVIVKFGTRSNTKLIQKYNARKMTYVRRHIYTSDVLEH